jgi:hypothetical protein
MQMQARRSEEAEAVEIPELAAGGRQWLAVSAHVVERYLITFRAPAASLARLVPPPLTVDAFAGHGFVSVCALELARMGLAGTPGWLRFHNLELLYRIGVRFRGEPSFLTLRSDVSARPLAWLGRRFSHYRPHLADFQVNRDRGFRLDCRSPDGAGDGFVDLRPGIERAPGSLFPDAGAAAAFLLGMRFSVDRRPDGRVLVQDIDHQPWGARLARLRGHRLAYLERLQRAIGVPLVHDHTLGMRDLHQTWRAARWA